MDQISGLGIDKMHLILDWDNSGFCGSFCLIGLVLARLPHHNTLLGVTVTLPTYQVSPLLDFVVKHILNNFASIMPLKAARPLVEQVHPLHAYHNELFDVILSLHGIFATMHNDANGLSNPTVATPVQRYTYLYDTILSFAYWGCSTLMKSLMLTVSFPPTSYDDFFASFYTSALASANVLPPAPFPLVPDLPQMPAGAPKDALAPTSPNVPNLNTM